MQSPNQSLRRNMRPTVLVAEASQMDCQLVGEAIERHRRFHVVGCAVSSDDVISAIREKRPDVAVISTRLMDGPCAGLSALQKLRAAQIPSRMVMLLDSDDRELVVESFRGGAHGVFNRSGSYQQLCKCIAEVYQGQIWASKEEMRYVVEALAQSPRSALTNGERTKSLSKREHEVAQLVVAGLTNREIGERLKLNEHTVKNYLSRVFEKSGVSSRTELMLQYWSQVSSK